MKKLLNISYGSIHGTYWVSFAVFFSFASVFLLAKTYSNTMIGFILAMGNIVAIVTQPFLADFADRTKKFSLIQICVILSILIILSIFAVAFAKPSSLIMTTGYILIIGLVNIMQPLINTLSFKLQESGYYVNFGITRSIGSMTYAIATSILGGLVSFLGVDILPIAGIMVFILVIGALLFTKNIFETAKEEKLINRKLDSSQNDKLKSENENALDKNKNNEIDLKSFLKRHKLFFLLNVGVFGLFFSNQTMNGFMLQIVRDVGGNSKDMGLVFTLIATLEIPTLIFYDKIRKYISTRILLKLSAIAYVLQITTCYLAKDVSLLFAAQLFQPLSFALVLPSMVHMINETMEESEAVKGQSIFTMTVMFTTIVATIVGGIIIDSLSIKSLLLISSLVTLFGCFIIFMSIKKLD